MRPHRPELVATEVVAVVIAMIGAQPHLLTVGAAEGVASLPAGPLRSEHRSLQAGLRDWVGQLTGHRLGHVEQLYTFADRERLGAHQRLISVSYLGLTGTPDAPQRTQRAPGWRSVYDFFPAEDQRGASENQAFAELCERVRGWAREPSVTAETAHRRAARVQAAYGFEPVSPDCLARGDDSGDADRPGTWEPEHVLARYELAWEAGALPESHRTGPHPAGAPLPAAVVGEPMLHDHRRILATGLARLRSTIQYRPLVFELMPAEFTLRGLQDCVEAISGTHVHAPNFRRLVLGQHLVEETGSRATRTGGRPAKLYRFVTSLPPGHEVGLTLPRVR